MNIIKKLKNSLAFGHDEIDAVTVKLTAGILAPSIAHIINLSLGTNKFPARWKIGRVIPLLKSNELVKTNPSSYRPVTQLSLVSKLTEKCAQVQILDHLERTNQLSRDHHAYRTLLSTTTALTQVTDTIVDAIDSNEIASSMCIDQSAALIA